MKVKCKKCGELLPRTHTYFYYLNKDAKKLNSVCIKCVKNYNKRLRAKRHKRRHYFNNKNLDDKRSFTRLYEILNVDYKLTWGKHGDNFSPILEIIYKTKDRDFKQWFNIKHSRFKTWFMEYCPGIEFPKNVEDLLEHKSAIRTPTYVNVLFKSVEDQNFKSKVLQTYFKKPEYLNHEQHIN